MAMEIKKAEVEGTYGVVVIEGDNPEELMSPRCRKLAYEQRVKLGMPTAGIDDRGFEPIGVEENELGRPVEAPSKFRRTFRLTPMPA